MTTLERRILETVGRDGVTPIRLIAIGEEIDISLSEFGRALKALSSRGWIERYINPSLGTLIRRTTAGTWALAGLRAAVARQALSEVTT